MSEKYIFDTTEKKDILGTLRLRLIHVKAHPQDYHKNFAEKLEKLITAYESHPDAQLVVVKEI